MQQILDICSGTGAFTLGAEISNSRMHRPCFKTVAFCDIDRDCRELLSVRFPSIPIFENIRNVSAQSLHRAGITRIDGIIGGFPCQPYSRAGKKQGSTDDRNLWPEIRRIIREVQPGWAVFENVPGLLTSESGKFFAGLLRDLAEMGFDAEWGVLPCAYMEAGKNEFIGVGGTHIRERVWIIAYSQGRREREECLRHNCDLQAGSGIAVECGGHDGNAIGHRCQQQLSSTNERWEDIGVGDELLSNPLPQSPICERDDGVAALVDGCLLQQSKLGDWLGAATIPLYRREPRSSLELSQAEIKALSPADRAEYQRLKREYYNLFDRELEKLEDKSKTEYRQLQEQLQQEWSAYQEVRRSHKTALKQLGNGLVPQVAAQVFEVLLSRLRLIDGKS